MGREHPGLTLLCSGALLIACTTPPPPPPPDPQAERDRECAQRFITPRFPTPEDVALVYPLELNPRDPQGRPIYVGRQHPQDPRRGYCYVEPGLGPPGVPLPTPMVGPPGLPGSRQEVPCPPQMQDARWWACPEGKVVTNAARCPCACFATPVMAPPSILPMPCPPG